MKPQYRAIWLLGQAGIWCKPRANKSRMIGGTIIGKVMSYTFLKSCLTKQQPDADAAARRLVFIAKLPLLELSNDVDKVSAAIIASGLLPQQATRDAIHIGASAVHGVDILLTWNCRHIANAAIMRELGQVVAAAGYQIPIICTPEELLAE